MSVLDDLRSMEQRVAERLAELEPLANEYNELRAEAERFNLSRKTNGTKASPTSRPRATTRRRRAKRAQTALAVKAAPAKLAETAPAVKAANASSPTSAKPRPGQRQAAASPGRRREQVLALVNDNPGITVAELGRRLNVDATSLYRHVNRLSADGQIRKSGRELQPS